MMSARPQARWANLFYTSLTGDFKYVTVIYDSHFEERAKSGFGKLDGSSVPGFRSVERSDLVLKPDMSTLRLDPFAPESVFLISDIYEAETSDRFIKDPRYVAQRVERHLEELGLKALVGAEVEFHIIDELRVWITPLSGGYAIKSNEASVSSKKRGIAFKSGYHASMDLDSTYEIRGEIARTLYEYFNIVVESHHHEVGAAGQVEINVRASTPLGTGDAVQILKYVAKKVCSKRGKVATFLPKITSSDNGSGMHVHVSLWRGADNIFYDEGDEYANLSQEARYFIGGLLEHGRALSAIVSPTVNSYRRLVPHYEAPTYLAWGKSNRSSAVRIPGYNSAPSLKRVEYRPPDPSCNPYLAIPAVIMAGLDGMKKKIEPPPPSDVNLYALEDSTLERLGVKRLPRTLIEALEELESDYEFLLPVFPRELLRAYIEVKKKEWEAISRELSPAELYYYSYL